MALVAMAIPAHATGKTGGIAVGGSVSGSLSVSKEVTAGAPAAAVGNPSAVPNPSAPAVEANTGATVALAAPVLDVQIKKVPIVTVSDAPCQKVCKDQCSITLEKTCSQVPVTEKKCETVTKPVTKRMCSKKCSIMTPAVEVPAPAAAIPNPSMPNPSTPVDAGASATAGVQAKADMSAQVSGAGVDINKSASLAVTAGKNRKLQTVLLPLAAKAAVAKAVGAKIAGAVAGVNANLVAAGNVAGSLQCEDVCEDVASTESEVVCQDVTTQVERCGFTPKRTCQQECVCIPMKSVSLNLPVKPIQVSMAAGN